MRIIDFSAVALSVGLFASSGFSQTTLPGNSDVDGSFAVGNSTNKGGLTVTGETGNSAAPGLQISGDGGVLFEGVLGSGQLPTISNGPHFFWYPKKAAFVSNADNLYSSDANIGVKSFAFRGKAVGDRAVAIGDATALEDDSFAFAGAIAEGEGAVAGGFLAISSGYHSVAFMQGRAYGSYSLALVGGEAYGNSSTAVSWASALGDWSFALGARKFPGTDLSAMALALGHGSVALGGGATANAYGSIVLGAGTAEGNPDAWVATDPQFVVGYGTGNLDEPSPATNRNAFVVYKNGNISMPKRQGDILMGEFGLPE